jgi:HEAT repeat protein
VRTSTLLLASPLLAGCASFQGAVADLEALHEEKAEGVLVHRSEVTRLSAFGRAWLASPFRALGSKLLASPRKETLPEPDRLCRESLRALRKQDFRDAAILAESVHWASFLLEEDPHPLSRTEAAVVLAGVPPAEPVPAEGATGDPDVIASIRAVTGRLDSVRRGEALDAAGRAELGRRIDLLGSAPYHRSSDARGIARSLARLGRVEPDPALAARSASASRVASARAARLSLTRGLADPSEFVREACVEGIVRLEGEGALPGLGAAVEKDPSPSVRRRVVRLCARAPSSGPAEEPVLAFLVRALGDPDPSVAANAMEALSLRTGRERTLDREYWRAWWRRRDLERPAGGRW